MITLGPVSSRTRNGVPDASLLYVGLVNHLADSETIASVVSVTPSVDTVTITSAAVMAAAVETVNDVVIPAGKGIQFVVTPDEDLDATVTLEVTYTTTINPNRRTVAVRLRVQPAIQ